MLTKLARYIRDHHVGLLALVVAMSGTAYAASLPRNSVGNKQLKKNAVTASKIKNRSLTLSEFKRGQLPKGDKGDKGDKGATGDRGPQGPKGDQGVAGVVGNLFVARKDVPLNDNANANDFVACPAGQKILGGSVNIAATTSADVNITVSRPSRGGAAQLVPADGDVFDGWRGAAVNPTGGTANTTMRIWAICTPGTQQTNNAIGQAGD
jgi:hypothetical protein